MNFIITQQEDNPDIKANEENVDGVIKGIENLEFKLDTISMNIVS